MLTEWRVGVLNKQRNKKETHWKLKDCALHCSDNILITSCRNVKDTCYLWCKNNKNLWRLNILACNSANKRLFCRIWKRWLKDAPIYFSNIFISFLGLTYSTPSGFPLRLNFFGQFSGTRPFWCSRPLKNVWPLNRSNGGHTDKYLKNKLGPHFII